jgi:hypothetical protein
MIHSRQDYNRIQDPAGLIPADEPVFLIRGQDVCAVETIEYYARLYENIQMRDEKLLTSLQKQIERIKEWQKTHIPKSADLPKEIQ